MILQYQLFAYIFPDGLELVTQCISESFNIPCVNFPEPMKKKRCKKKKKELLIDLGMWASPVVIRGDFLDLLPTQQNTYVLYAYITELIWKAALDFLCSYVLIFSAFSLADEEAIQQCLSHYEKYQSCQLISHKTVCDQ